MQASAIFQVWFLSWKLSCKTQNRWVSLVGRYCVRPQGAWGSIPQYCRPIFCNMACSPGLTWPGRKVPRGDVTSNPESVDSLPKADWWCHPNITQRWHYCRYCAISGQISQSMGIASPIRQPLMDHTVQQSTRWWLCGSFCGYIRF